MLGSILLLILSSIIFTHGNDYGVEMHLWRETMSVGGFWFPLDVPGIAAIIIWFVDWFAIVIFNTFRYPIRIQGKDIAFHKTLPTLEKKPDEQVDEESLE